MPAERIDALVLIMVGAMLGIFAYLLTWFKTNPELAQMAQIMLIFGIIGIMARFFALLMGERVAFSMNLPGARAVPIALSAGMLVVGAGAIWGQIQPGLSVDFLAGTTINVQRAYFVLAAIAEECFFQWGVLLFGVALLSNRSLVFMESLKLPGEPIALVGASILFAVWHVAVYGTGPEFQLMFVYRFLFGLSYLLPGYLWGERYVGVAMLAHAAINYIAAGGMA